MTYCDLCVAEQQRRKQIVSETRTMIYAHLQVQEDDGASLLTSYSGYYLQILVFRDSSPDGSLPCQSNAEPQFREAASDDQ